MKKFLLFVACLFIGSTAFAQSTPVPTVIDNLSGYTGSDPYVLNKADGKVYVLNNMGEYERYGIYENVANLNVAKPVQQAVIEYIETRLGTSTGFINTGYIHKSSTKVVADVEITQNTAQNWEAIFGARNGNWERNAFVVFYRSDKDGAGDKGCFSRTFEGGGRYEQPGTDEIPMNTRITVTAEGRTVTFTRQGESQPAASITAGNDDEVADDGVNTMYIFDLNTDGPDGNRRDNSRGYMKLYSFKIYEDGQLVRDFVPVVTDMGEAGVRDQLTGEVRVAEDGQIFLSPDGEEIANSGKGMTVYEGKLVFNTTDQNLYKYTNGSFQLIGPRTFQDAETREGFVDYRNLNNWETNPDHTVVYDGKISYDEATGMNEINNYEGIGGHEPLMVKLPTVPGETYNFTYKYTNSPYNSWHGVEMRTYIANFYDLWTSHSGIDVGGDILATYTIPFAGTETETTANLEFTAEQDSETLVYQFGDVNDGALGFWFHFSDLQLQKLEYPEAYPVINIYKPQLEKLIPEVESYSSETTGALQAALAEALTAAKAALNSDDMEAQHEALDNLQKAFDNVKSINTNDFVALQKTIALAQAEGINTAEAEAFFQEGTSQGQLNDLLKSLRFERKNFHAERQANVFKNNDVKAGEFYLYNVGQQRFLTGGSDWGAHASLGMPGTLLTLENIDAPEAPGEGEEEQANRPNVETDFHINTGLRNGGPDDNPSQYLGYRGYMDSGKAGAWRFVKLENGNYNILQADYPDAFVVFNPDCSVDGGHGDHTTVCTEQRGELDPNNLDAQWILVTKADRDALLESATETAPADASYYIVNPGFNQRAEVEPAWQIFNGSVWGRNDNHSDFALESWNSNDCSFSTSVTGLKPGFYLISVQGFYRDGHHGEQARLITEEGIEPAQKAYVYSGMSDVLLPNITAEVDKAPGLGNMTSVGEYPDGIDQAVQFFQLGLYKVQILVEVDASGILDIGVAKDEKGHEGDWVVVDNFRLTYYGAQKPDLTGVNDIKATTVNNGKIYNLQGVEVKNPTQRGIYIINGKKFVVK
ncbi:MAG: hypothetical protein J6Y23_05620 [Prevotella sp.]|nr:hypothetical protein [Prevotella sp.]